MSAQIAPYLLVAIQPFFLNLHFTILLRAEGLAYHPGDSMIAEPGLTAHDYIDHYVLMRSPESSLIAMGFSSFVLPPMRKTQLRPSEKL